MKRVHESLDQVFQRNRLVFWYDPNGDWTQDFESFIGKGIEKLRVAGNEFGTKVRIVRDPDPNARFLVYIPSARPPDARNWLLDLLLQGYVYKADKASLALHEAGLRQEFLPLAEEHAEFFRAEKRTQALKALVTPDDQSLQIRLKMMAILAGSDAEVDIDAMLLGFLGTGANAGLFDPVADCFSRYRLVEPFWKEVARIFGYNAAAPGLRDFAVSLFRGANPLDSQVNLNPHARVFLRRWKDSQAHSGAFREWSQQLEKELHVAAALERIDARTDARTTLADADAFEIFDRFTLHLLCKSFEKGASAGELRAAMQQRRSSFWYPAHRDGYEALEQSVQIRELLANAELSVGSIHEGAARYTASWWRIDLAYRSFTMHLRRYGQIELMKHVSAWVKTSYVNNFLLPLADLWSDRVRQLDTWECDSLTPQSHFFESYVRPFLRRGQKVFVIVSDALRYEAAAEFALQLNASNRWTAEIEAMLGALPSYTQLGMAALLPGKELSLDPRTGNVSVDGRSATGTPNRTEILNQSAGAKATAIQAADFIELNSKTDGRALMRDHEVVYIYHNHIDDVADSNKTERKTVDAVEQAFDELNQIIRKVANINGSNMLLTADHGFLFQQDEVDTGDMAAMPQTAEWTYLAQRFAIGKGIQPSTAIKTFSAHAMGLTGEFSVAFPLSLGRFPRPGSGKRYVHGGISLQEVMVPVVKIHKARSDDTEQVKVELMRAPSKITTGQLSISLFQDRPVEGKVLPRSLIAALYAKDGTLISEEKKLTFDSTDPEARNRETPLLLALSHAADEYNGQEVELNLREQVKGSEHFIPYSVHYLKLQKPFASDFDEF